MRSDLIFASWLRTRRAMSLSAARIAERRSKLWSKLQLALARTPALANYAGGDLEAFPVTEIADMRADYGAWNSLSISETDLRGLADAAENGANTGPISAGWSSGTSGSTRGLFIASPAERADYVGQSLARLLPVRALFARQRLALHLRASNALYSDVSHSRFAFAHFPLEAEIDQTMRDLAQFRPTILIAPPHKLIEFARHATRLPAIQHLFCGSEPISEGESQFIAAHFGKRPRSIYQATEGFLGAECAHGRMHLNDHAMAIELEPVTGTSGFRPIITDLRRFSQPIVRVRGDDYIELDDRRCECGFAGRIIAPPQGRVSDIWRFNTRIVSPSLVVSSVESVLGGDKGWQAEAGPDHVEFRVTSSVSAELANAAVQTLVRNAKLSVPVKVSHDLSPWSGPKRQKVVWQRG